MRTVRIEHVLHGLESVRIQNMNENQTQRSAEGRPLWPVTVEHDTWRP
jgi:hypothetical protein